jgi:hypothetical protein
LEKEFPPVSVDETSLADAIVIFGGAVHMVDSTKGAGKRSEPDIDENLILLSFSSNKISQVFC